MIFLKLGLITLSNICGHLQSFSFQGVYRATQDSILKLVTKNTNLQRLEFPLMTQFADNNLNQVLKCTPRLEHLNVRKMGLTDVGVGFIAQSVGKQLKTLILKLIDRITDNGIQILCGGCPNLENLGSFDILIKFF